MINYFFKRSEIPICTLALVIRFQFTPLDISLPPLYEFRIPNFIRIGPVIFQIHFVSYIKFRFFGLVDRFERVRRSWEAGGV